MRLDLDVAAMLESLLKKAKELALESLKAKELGWAMAWQLVKQLQLELEKM